MTRRLPTAGAVRMLERAPAGRFNNQPTYVYAYARHSIADCPQGQFCDPVPPRSCGAPRCRGGDDLLIANFEPSAISANLAPGVRPACPRAPTLPPFAIPRCSSLLYPKNAPCSSGRENPYNILKTLGNLPGNRIALAAIPENHPANRKLQGDPARETVSLLTASSATQWVSSLDT